MARVYFVTGKGGTGKSVLARSLAEKISTQDLKVLLIKIDSFSLSTTGDDGAQFKKKNLWEQKLHLHRVMEEYFETTLAKIPVPGALQKVAQKIQETVATKLLANKYVLRFVETCPGLTPSIFLGKVCWEAQDGGPDTNSRWDVVIVDAPSTGQALQIFDSAKTLSRVLTKGLISNHIADTLKFAYSHNFEIHLMTLPEEGPLQECEEMIAKFSKLELKVSQVWINKVVPEVEEQALRAYNSKDEVLSKAIQTELERIADQKEAIQKFEATHLEIKKARIRELSSTQDVSFVGELP
ncbi:MAG: ArsA-related P-loop ATPase [Bdellovibrionota bacterium]